MKVKVELELRKEDWSELKDLARGYQISVSDILENYIKDLTYSKGSNGSDEREMANEYFSRSIENYGEFSW